MILAYAIAILLLAGIVAWMLGGVAARVVTLLALVADLGLAAVMFATAPTTSGWWRELDAPWLPGIGVRLHLAVDGLSAVLIVLTLVLGVIAVAASWTEIRHRVGLFHAALLWVLAGILGVFTALDLLVFALFWELMLVPMYFLIGLWGHEDRMRAAIKFFLFTQASGLLMFVAIVALAAYRHNATGEWSFQYGDLFGFAPGGAAGFLMMLGFFIAFTVKVPAVPLHTWLPDAHTEAPTAGSVILAGLLLKTGVYGLLRFALPLFPDASIAIAPLAMLLGVVGILYGAVLAYAQTDLKRLVAYTSVSHLGFALLGIYAMTPLAHQGVVLEMICHGLSTGGLFVVVGALQERIHTRDLGRMGGFWATAPRMGAATTVLAMASLGLPGLGNFVAEFAILFGAFATAPWFAAAGTVGLVFATVYSLRIIQRAFHGGGAGIRLADLSRREVATLGTMIALLVWLGLYPQPVIAAVDQALDAVQAMLRLGDAVGGPS